MGNIRRESTYIMIFPRNSNRYRKLSIVIFGDYLPRLEEFKLQTTPKPCLVDIRQQRGHLSFTRELFLKLNNILLNLLSLLLQRIQTNSLDKLFLIIISQCSFLTSLTLQLNLIILQK